jgi:threonylcarbamoyladenosine tRNA methylthiotransferase MtaB
VAKHLSAQMGKTHHILMENPRMGRTDQFTEVSFQTDQPESQIVTATITGMRDQQLIA